MRNAGPDHAGGRKAGFGQRHSGTVVALLLAGRDGNRRARINAPEEAKTDLARIAPRLLPLAERLIAPCEEIDACRITAIIRSFLHEQGAEQALEAPAFHDAVTRFHAWVTEHADWLDGREPNLALWLREETPPAGA